MRSPVWLTGPILLFWMAALAAPVAAQDAGLAPAQSTPRAPSVFTAYDFHLNAIRLSSEDVQFSWDADFGGDIDLVDYGAGRLNFLANYEAVIGDERSPFDVNQATYTLALRASLRNPRHEIAAVFNHVSRHLSDRVRPFAVDWNMVGAEYWRRDGSAAIEVRTTARALFAIQRSFVDYNAELGGRVEVEAGAGQVASAIGRGVLTLIPVDESILGRERQWSTRLEGGVRLLGDAAAVELVVGYERRLDAHPLQLETQDWLFVGFRFLNR